MEWIDINDEQPTTEGKYLVKTKTNMGNVNKVESLCSMNKGKAHFNVSGQIVTHWLKEETNNVVYAFKYCPCIHDSSFGVVSLHKTRKGAEIAMEFHKNEELKEFNDWTSRLDKDHGFVFGQDEIWDVQEVEIKN